MFKNRGFTLVELMIVIAIIGILSAALFPVLTSYLSRARDTNRKAVMSQLSVGIILYQMDKNRLPSTVGNWCDPQSPECDASGVGPYNYLKGELVPSYIQKIPIVTSNTNFGYFVHDYRGYYTCPSGLSDIYPDATRFSLYTPLENPTEKDTKTLSEVFDICLSGGGYSGFHFKMTN